MKTRPMRPCLSHAPPPTPTSPHPLAASSPDSPQSLSCDAAQRQLEGSALERHSLLARGGWAHRCHSFLFFVLFWQPCGGRGGRASLLHACFHLCFPVMGQSSHMWRRQSGGLTGSPMMLSLLSETKQTLGSCCSQTTNGDEDIIRLKTIEIRPRVYISKKCNNETEKSGKYLF